ncbi:MAG: M1 family aminopeptidase [Gemmatimonadales bacterium]|jgi:aminopeptidase N
MNMMNRRARELSALALSIAAAAGGCDRGEAPDTSPGVSWELASDRRDRLGDLEYELSLTVPETSDGAILGHETIRFQLVDDRSPLAIDFAGPREGLHVRVGGVDVAYDLQNDHIVIPDTVLAEGVNSVQIDFLAGDEPLNRNPDFLYTLFVPERARFAFPCFDQPDLKARYRLELALPEGWVAVANGAMLQPDADPANVVRFAETAPISTYLFSFAAGAFEIVSAERAGRTMRMYHRETDSAKLARNLEAIFDLHAAALSWLEEYTGIEYPFEKFDFVLVPSFQYGGMEHPGAILYSASRLLLDESATQNDELRRASLIAHETSHMWFGDLVTMKWFDDVWMKEVFANFMAAKIVNPTFPDVDHELRFLLAHYPAAYAVDRTAGANPIRQNLDNLAEAGNLYGAVIYQKAPIVMRQLERLVGEMTLRDGLREYLHTYGFDNASWPDLIEIIDSRTEQDLEAWSRIWIEEAGRPTISTSRSLDQDGAIASFVVRQTDPAGRGRRWPQSLDVVFGYPHTTRSFPVRLRSDSAVVDAAVGLPHPDYVLPNGQGLAYGLFLPDSSSLEHLLAHTASLPPPLSRGIAWLTVWDALLEGRAEPGAVVDLATTALMSENDELLVQRILDYLQSAYWQFLSGEEREKRGPDLEDLLWALVEGVPAPTRKAAYFNAYRSIAVSDSAVARMERLWSGDQVVAGLDLSESDFTRLAQELAVRQVTNWERILQQQRQRIENPDRRRRFEFVEPALSADPMVRERFFASLAQVENREHEPWVIDAVGYLHHPLRASESEKFIRPSLELLQEIQVTGDIFFPKNWLDATLGRRNTPAAAAIVRGFLQRHPDYPPRLTAKILQSADDLFRAVEILAPKR